MCLRDQYAFNHTRHVQELISTNFLHLSWGDACVEAIRQYGVGTCGPRGFYGTFDIHISLEKELAAFLDMEAAIVYPAAFSAVTTTKRKVMTSSSLSCTSR